MTAENNLIKMQKILTEAFKAQDPEDTSFDVTFEVGGKRIYATKYHLCNLSTTFKSMLSERWISKDAVIKVESYTSDEFYQLLLFIYSGDCTLSNANVSQMVDMAEFYNVEVFKEFCDDFISNMQCDLNNVFDLIDIVTKYSLPKSKPVIDSFVESELLAIVECDRFMSVEKYLIEALLTFKRNIRHEEKLFDAIYTWAENKCIKKFGKRKNFNIKDKIKAELDQLLPFIKFVKMSPMVFNDIIATKYFLFSPEQLKAMLIEHQEIHVTVWNNNHKYVDGKFFDNWNIMNVIYNNDGPNGRKFYTNAKPDVFKKTDTAKFYFLVSDHRLMVKKAADVTDHDYLICEMTGDMDFEFNDKCQFRLSRNCFM